MRPLIPLLLASGTLSALNIQIDYTYDDNNFFDTQEKKDAIESVAKFYGDLLQDNLLRIDSSEFSSTSTWTARPSHPATGDIVEIVDLVVPEDTIIVFVGSRVLTGSTRGRGGPGGLGASGSGSWLTRLIGRGQPGADRSIPNSEKTDIALWGGAITFDDDSIWNFSLEENQSGVEFLKIALHEMGHVLGLGPSSSWDNLISEGNFTGPAAIASHGSAPPADGSHFLTSLNSPLYGSYGTTHGDSAPVLMLGSSTDNGSNFDVITDLDLAALIDIGWELSVPTQLTAPLPSPAGATFSWPSSSFCSYQVRRSSDLENFNAGSAVIIGNGLTQSWNDPSPDPSKAFYQFEVTTNTSVAKSKPVIKATKSLAKSEAIESIEIAPRFATGCYCEHPEGH